MAKNKDHGTLKVKKKTIKDQLDEQPVKVDLKEKQGEVVDTTPTKVEIKEEKDAVQEQSPKKVDVLEVSGDGETVGKTHEEPKEPTGEGEEKVEEDSTPIVEIGETPEETSQPVKQAGPQMELPENIQNLVNFMNETGGTLDDYARLNADYSKVDDDTLLKEYYKKTKPHLNQEEIDFLMEEKFRVDEDYDEERAVRKKNLAKKEEVAKAKNFLENLKKEYYEEIKLRPTVSNEMQKANEFFSKFKQEQQIAQQQREEFKTSTNNFFSEEFKGFDFAVGEKKFRYAINNPNEVANAQSDISNIIKKFLNNKGEVVDVKGYHKAMYAASNADTLAQHFYEQGQADAVKNVVAQSKNIKSGARQTKPADDIYLNGLKVKAISGINSAKLKIKKK